MVRKYIILFLSLVLHQIDSVHSGPFDIPGGVAAKNTPQMILISYSGSVTEDTRTKIRSLMPDTIKNPDGCPASITIFTVGKNSDYCEIHKLYVRGHEIATQGFNLTNYEDWSKERWKAQVAEHRDFLTKFAYIPKEDVVGVRAPNVRPGGDKQFSMMNEEGFLYDASIYGGPSIWQPAFHRKSYWPFLVNKPYEEIEKCQSGECPKEAYPMIWEVPLTRILHRKISCAFLYECAVNADLSVSVQELLLENFERSYQGNRAPFQINLDVLGLRNSAVSLGISSFLEDVQQYGDVWIVSYMVSMYMCHLGALTCDFAQLTQ